MSTMAELNALVAAHNTGALRVRQGDKEVTYRDKADMRATISEMAAALGVPDPLASTRAGRVRAFRFSLRSGY